MAQIVTNTATQIPLPKDEAESKPWLPTNLQHTQSDPKHNLFGKDALESLRQEILIQRSRLTEADRQLKAKVQQALTFNAPQNHYICTSGQSGQPCWLSEKVLEQAKDTHLSHKYRFNQDIFAQKLLCPKYNQRGDILAINNDLNTHQTAAESAEAYRKNREKGWGGKGRLLPYDLMEQSKSVCTKQTASLLELPPNIQHTFGSKICSALFTDKVLVNMAIERQKTMTRSPQPSKHEEIQALPINLENNYEILGQFTRYNTFPGLTSDCNLSSTQKDFNGDIHLRRVQDPNKFCHKRDEMSKWSEFNILRERMKKAWDDAHPIDGKKQ